MAALPQSSAVRLDLVLLPALALLAGAASGEAGEVRVRVQDETGRPLPAVVALRATADPGFELSARAHEATGLATFPRVPPGAYRATAQTPGFMEALREIRVGSAEILSLTAALAPPRGASSLKVADRWRPSYGVAFDEERLRDLPGGRHVWSLPETADPFVIVDRIDGGGLYTGEPALMGAHGSSWTQASFRLGELDITDPERGGTPLLQADPASLAGLDVASATMPVEIGSPGAAVTLVPRRPGGEWRGVLEGQATGSRLQGANALPHAPSVARFGSWHHVGLTAGGPIVQDRAGLLLSAAHTRSRRFERDESQALEGRADSLLAHLVLTPSARDEVRVLAALQSLEHPYAGRARFSNRDVSQSDRFLHLQSTWERRGEGGALWSLSGGFQRDRLRPNVGERTPDGVVERLLDGPVPELAFAADSRRQRWDLSARLQPDLRGFHGGRHEVRLGLAVGQASVATRPPGPGGLTGESVNGLPARIWDYGYAGPESHRRATELTAYAADRFLVSDRLQIEAGLRLEATSGSARGAPEGIRWRSLAPRLTARWRITDFAKLTFFGAVGRYPHRLLLQALAFGDPAGAQGSVHLWNDVNGDRRVQPAERGALVARVGPGGPFASIDPRLRGPRTDELLLGLEMRPLESLVLRFAAIHRPERDLLESVNVGVPLASYRAFGLPDPYVDFVGPADDRILPVYDRSPASFGQDRYLLTNPPRHTTLHEAFELTLEKAFGRRLQFLVGATAYRSEGSSGYSGFRAQENDQGLIGELFDDPNADTYARGRFFFDRNYVVKLSGSYRAPGDIRLGVVARYQDGQPFSRLVVVPGLAQGPEAIQAVPDGRHRFTFTLTVDARLEKGFRIRGARAAAVLEAFNLLNTANSVEEDATTRAAFRNRPAALVQPPRALRLGLRLDF